MKEDGARIKTAYLTFDDGPNYNTESILKILEDYDIRATFFNTGEFLEYYKSIVKKIISGGHSLGHHSMSHDWGKLYIMGGTFIKEMDGCDEILQKISGIKSKLIRAPYGSHPNMDKNLRNLVKDRGYKLWDWHVDSLDVSDCKYVEDIVEAVKKEINKYEEKNVNPIILFHNVKQTIRILPHIIVYLKERGYRFEGLNEDMEPVSLWDDIDKNYESYIAGKDDTLSSIAEAVKVNSKYLKEINGLASEEIYDGKVLYTTPKWSRSLNKPSELIIKGDTKSKKIALTFDAGFEDKQTSEILDILKRHNIEATFFLTGIWVERFPKLSRRIASEGHEIGNHSYNHPDFTKISHDEILNNIVKGEYAILRATGINPRPLFREPYGHWNKEVFKAVGDAGYKYSVYWSIDTIDWQMPSPRVIVNRILRKVKGGDIILMHLATDTTAEALEIAIRNLTALGYEFVKVSDLIEGKEYNY